MFRNETDEYLVYLAQNGDKKAIDELVKRYRDKILFTVYDLVGNYEESRDIAQDVFHKMFKNIAGYQKRSKFSTWLYRIAMNTTFDFLKKRNRLDNINFEAENEILHTANESELTGFYEDIAPALEKLSIRQRTVITLKYFQYLSNREIAGILECKENTVRIHLFRGLERLRKMLNKTGDSK